MSKSIYGNDKLEKLKVGDIMNLGAGYDFLQSIRRVCSEMTECIAVDKVILLRLKEALEIGRDSAALEAENYHSSMKGYRENMHKQLDSDVETIKSAEDEIQALIDSLPMIPTCPLSDDEIIKLGYKAGFAIDTVENEETSDEEEERSEWRQTLLLRVWLRQLNMLAMPVCESWYSQQTTECPWLDA